MMDTQHANMESYSFDGQFYEDTPLAQMQENDYITNQEPTVTKEEYQRRKLLEISQPDRFFTRENQTNQMNRTQNGPPAQIMSPSRGHAQMTAKLVLEPNNQQKSKDNDDIAMPLIKSGTSMMPDMKFGWKPEVKCSHPPIPLYFDFVQHMISKYQFGDDFDNFDTIVYQEKRPADSYQMHKRFANQQLQNGTMSYKFSFPKNHDGGRYNYDGLLEQIFGSRDVQAEANDPDEFLGMNPDCERANQLQGPDEEHKFLYFDADFEGGNLDLVIFDNKMKSYDVFLRPDTNTTGYFQWFYFRVKNKKKGTKCRINIVNMTKRNSLYQQGMPVMVLSLKKAKQQGATWTFGSATNVKYGLSKLMQRQTNQFQEGARQRLYFQFGWDYTFEYDDDEVFFAYSMPYSFSMVTNFIQQIQDQQFKIIEEFHQKKKEEDYNDPNVTENTFKVVETSMLTTSLGGIDVPMLTITDFGQSKEEEARKKVVVITGRVHPGETNASWLVHGIIKFLLSKDKVASALRRRCIFKIIPMINADGVTIGNTRCSFIGRDINRLFSSSTNQKLMPEPFHLRKLVSDIQKPDKHKIMAYLDVHAHSGRKSIFMYGPYFPLHCSKYMKIRTIPKLISERTEMFRFFSCKFKVEKYKENCARIAIWRDFNITNCFTIEASSFGFISKDRETLCFTSGLLQEFGEYVIQSIFEYNLIQDEDRRMKMALAKKLKAQRKTRKRTIAEILGDASTKNKDSKLGDGILSQDEGDECSAVKDKESEDEKGNSTEEKRVELQNEQDGNNPQEGNKWLSQFMSDPNPNEADPNSEFGPSPDNTTQAQQVQGQILIQNQKSNQSRKDQSPSRRVVNVNAISPSKVPGGTTSQELNFTNALKRLGQQQDISEEQRNPAQISASSMDSHALAESSSSDDMVTPMSNLKIEAASKEMPDSMNKSGNHASMLQPKFYQKREDVLDKNGQKVSQVQQMLKNRIGFEVMDADELFHLLSNQYYQEWKTKRAKYVKYDQLLKMKNERKHYRPAPNFLQKNVQNLGQQSMDSNYIVQNGVSVLQQQRDKYLTKEVRTFDEVYKSIKSKVNDFEQRRTQKQQRNSKNKTSDSKNGTAEKLKSDNEYDDEDYLTEDLTPMHNEYGNEIEDLGDIDDFEEEIDQDIGGGDREILDNRILGIIDVFQNMNQRSQISQKQLKILQELGNKNLSIEKSKELSGQHQTEGERKKMKKQHGSRDNLEQKPVTIGPSGNFTFVQQSSSNPQLAFGSMVPRTKPSTQMKKKRKIIGDTPDQLMVGLGHQIFPHSQGVQPTVLKPACNVYNIGGPTGINVTHTVHRAQTGTQNSRKNMASTSQNFSLKEEISGKRYEKFDKRGDIKSNSIIPQSQIEKLFQNHKYRMALDKPLLDMKLEIQGQQAQNNPSNNSYYHTANQSQGFKSSIIQNITNASIYKKQNLKKVDNNQTVNKYYTEKPVEMHITQQLSSIRKKKIQSTQDKYNPQKTHSKRVSRIVDDNELTSQGQFNIHDALHIDRGHFDNMTMPQKRINSADKYASQKSYKNQVIRNNSDFNEDNYPMIISTNLKNKNNNERPPHDQSKNQQIREQQQLYIYQTDQKDRFNNLQSGRVFDQSGSNRVSKQDFKRNQAISIDDQQAAAINQKMIEMSSQNFIIKKHVSQKNNRGSNIYSNMVGSSHFDSHGQYIEDDSQKKKINQMNQSISSNGKGSIMQSFNSKMANIDSIKEEYKQQAFNQKFGNIGQLQQSGEGHLNKNQQFNFQSSQPDSKKIQNHKLAPQTQYVHLQNQITEPNFSEDTSPNITQWNGYVVKPQQKNESNRIKKKSENFNLIGPESTQNMRGSSQIVADFDDPKNMKFSSNQRGGDHNLYNKDGKKRSIHKKVTMTETKRRQLGGSSRQQHKQQLQIVQPKKKGRQINTATITSSTFHPPRSQDLNNRSNQYNMSQIVVQANQQQQNFINSLFQQQEILQNDLQNQLTQKHMSNKLDQANALATQDLMQIKQTEMTIDQMNFKREPMSSQQKQRSKPQSIYILNTANSYQQNTIRKVAKFNSGVVEMSGMNSMFNKHQDQQQLTEANTHILTTPIRSKTGAHTATTDNKPMRRSSVSQTILNKVEHSKNYDKQISNLNSSGNVYKQ